MVKGARELFYQYGIGLGFLATVRPDGGPRLHPICPIITDEGFDPRSGLQVSVFRKAPAG